jgi:streptogramin lyase
MALPLGTIVVANPGFDGQNIGLFAVNPANGLVTTLAQGGMFVVPWNVVFLADGRLLVADATAFGTGGLIAFDPDSNQQAKVSSSSLFLQPYGLALAADGQVVVTYTDRPGQARGVVMRVNPANGDHRAVSGDFRFDFPFAVALDAAGNAIVTDPNDAFSGDPNRLIRIDIGQGAKIRADSPGFVFSGVAVEPTGNLVVTSDPGAGSGTQKLLRFHPTSGPPTVLSQGDKIRSPAVVAVEANGVILVLERPGAVLRVDPNTGKQSSFATSGLLRGATGITVRR